ncbi:DNA replication factor Cdt1 [Eupeodes corollae]|uniref:DNA replication factor Cdt1 n=1 Tax=Eupeodes corollae TaxID=290404 RepID=UPI002490230B|nr:DNA replication factor Cdt1 [Eupeodes corollae]XP_055920626.1 DNA replication factor Cdt1 [Eupeodes corollae]XP_055920627.1 DNA replication factor Cdt1 [Eupeodes corollae]XP_055920628.1 DNA replication factor Cdt1 [Eupeodes corollae]
MSQPSVASFFNTRKRAASELHLSKTRDVSSQPTPSSKILENDDISTLKNAITTRSGRTIKRIGVNGADTMAKISKVEASLKQQKLVKFVKKGNMSPRKKAPTPQKQNQDETTSIQAEQPSSTWTAKTNITNIERGMKTPVKQIIQDTHRKDPTQLKSMVKKELNFDEVKTKVSRHEKLHELKESLKRIQELEKTRKAQEERNRRLRERGPSTSKNPNQITLKEFKTIELEVLTSPAKGFKTPTKVVPPTPDKNELMSPKHTPVSKRVLFSPSKDGSPAKIVVPPAYQKFMHLVETSKSALHLPFKYRQLIETFKCLDSVCAMFFNRKEVITLKKLKPAVQRMLRRNFTETHLAQIKHIYPEAFVFTQMKMRNYGSASKQDYFQLVVTPNVEGVPHNKMIQIDEDNVLESALSNAMNPHVMTERLQKFQGLLLERTKHEHEKFLQSLDPPIVLDKHKLTRWHPSFDLEECPDIELGNLPQPPNVEKYSSAKDILSTARNLFNCATPMERAMERFDSKTVEEKNELMHPTNRVQPTETELAANKELDNLLKGVPKSLLEKIRAKQAAKALDAMTRRPSQDEEATMYSRLPELARHLRNVFITEKKGVLTLEIVIKKIQNSFRTSLTCKDIENHLQLISKVCPQWIGFHEVRKTMYLKISKDMDMGKVIEKLETVANEKTK